MSEPLYLLDTHALVWWMTDSHRLSEHASAIIADSENAILVSAASLWEISIKQRLGILSGCEKYLSTFESWHDRWGFGILPILAGHAVEAGLLPWTHKDPFDRMLVAQSRQTSAALVTCDVTIASYHPHCVWT